MKHTIMRNEILYELEYLIATTENGEYPSADDIIELLETLGVLNEEVSDVGSTNGISMRDSTSKSS